jgi:riboflavin synthase
LFTGLVQQVGKVASVVQSNGGARIEVSTPLASQLAQGDSVLVNGVCLTASGVGKDAFGADLAPETIRRSTLGSLVSGDTVNLELPLRAQDRLGGHIVQGHVDAVAEVRSISEEGGARDVWLSVPEDLLRYVVDKGSVTVDGVSLTVAGVDDDGFGVSLIPETLERTTLKGAEPGRRVNLEVDVLAKYVEKLVVPYATKGAGR